ncbi:MAG: ATPase, T2SS/T4P/T4SS family [Sulfuritalea sp.]|nr:ATPase, T2SS/T4P/T4SS family [Sulfuritalea sp.]
MLRDVVFSDIYLGQGASWLAGVPGKLDPVPTPPECASELAEIRAKCDAFVAENHKEEFAIRPRDVAYRVSVLKSLNEVVYVLRRFPEEVPKLDDLGLHPGYVEKLMEPRLTGLLVISGAFGQGKTTTASSVICARLSKYGGVAISIEDPPEMPLEGRHGEGVCYQTWVEQGGFSQACRQAARWAPSMIFVGEVRDPETATEALRASINGRLVVCTAHADSVVMAVERLYTLANGAAGNSEDVASLLSNGLIAVVHQRLEGDQKRLKTESIWLAGEESKGARNTIYQRRFSHLQNEVTLQLNRLLMGKKTAA